MEGKYIVLSNKDFLSFLNDETINTSSEDTLKKIIDEELQKDVEAMDTQRIEFCLDALGRLRESEQSQKKNEQDDSHIKHKRISCKKIFILAAAFVLLLAGIVYVSADKEEKRFGGIVEVFNDYVRIHFSETDENAQPVLFSGTQLETDLSEKGFDGIVLPELFRSPDTEIDKFDCHDYGTINTATVFMTCGDLRVNIFIDRYESDKMISHGDFRNVTSEVVKVQTPSADVFCCAQGDLSSLNYRSGLTLYSILLYDTPLEKAVKLAKTIQ